MQQMIDAYTRLPALSRSFSVETNRPAKELPEDGSGARVKSAADSATISEQGKNIHALFEKAVQDVLDASLPPFSEMMRQSDARYYIDVGRYNLYVIGKISEEFANQASQLGVVVDAKDVARRLAEESGVSITNPLAVSRKDMLPNNAFGNLAEQDVQALTDIYIYSKEHGLPTEQVGQLAFSMGVYRGSAGAWIEADIWPIPYLGYSGPRTATVADLIPDEVKQAAQEILAGSGSTVGNLDRSYLEWALNPRMGLPGLNVDLVFLKEIAGTGDSAILKQATLKQDSFGLGENGVDSQMKSTPVAKTVQQLIAEWITYNGYAGRIEHLDEMNTGELNSFQSTVSTLMTFVKAMEQNT